MDDQTPNYRREFFKSPHHAILGFVTLGLGFLSAQFLGLIVETDRLLDRALADPRVIYRALARPEYVDAFFNIVNWDEVNKNLKAALKR